MPTLNSKTGAARCWRFHTCEYLEMSRKLTVNGRTVKMESKPLEVLRQLLEHPTEVVSKDDLLDSVWGGVATTEQSVATAVSKLRKAVGGLRDAVILTEPGIGYRMAVPVSCVIDEEPGPRPLSLEPGDPIPGRPHWEVCELLSQYDCAPVWLAKHQKTQEVRVYKFAVDGVRLRTLQREVTISRLFQKSLRERADFSVKILDWAFEEAPFFIESEYCGKDLLEWSATEAFRQMSLEERVGLAAQVADAVASAHALGILHNDIKPRNVLIAPRSGRNESAEQGRPVDPQWQVRVADFGVASFYDLAPLREMEITDHGSFDEDGEGRHSTPVGTAMYRAPELHAGGVPTVLGDVYSLGVLLYQLVCGDIFQPPSPGWEARVSDLLLRRDIADAASGDPARRISSAASLAERLHRLPERRKEQSLREAADREACRAHEALARARLRRPWLIAAIAGLTIALCVSVWAYLRSARDAGLLKSQNDTLMSMNTFLSQDLLGQSNPYLGVAGSGKMPQQTLVDAIATAVPQIDVRFAGNAEVAARLHETIADSLRSRTRVPDADREYGVAAERFRAAEGPLSQNAIIAELKRELTALTGLLPGAVEAARSGYRTQEKLIAQLHGSSAELQAWQTLVKTALLGLGPHPEEALPLLDEAVRRAEATPAFDPMLLIRLKNQYSGVYVRMNDGAGLERVAREIIRLLTSRYGAGSATLFPLQMYLEEAFYMEEKYSEAIAQGTRNFELFERVLGRDHQLTLATLATKAAAEGQLELYDAAVRDDLMLYKSEQSNPSGRRMEEGSLNDAALFECHGGHFAQGIEHARQVIRETSTGPSAQPLFANGSMFTVGECLIAEQEAFRPVKKASLDEAEALIRRVDLKSIQELSGNTDYEGMVDVALARLALLRGQTALAKAYAARAEPFFLHTGSDPYERKALEAVKRASTRTR